MSPAQKLGRSKYKNRKLNKNLLDVKGGNWVENGQLGVT